MTMKTQLKEMAYNYKMESGEEATLADFFKAMELDFSSLPYEGFIHSCARGFMIANKENGWKGGYSYKKMAA